MDDPALDDGEKHGHHPEQDHHPAFEVAVIAAIVFRPEESGDGQNGGGKTADQQHDIMIAEKAGLVSIMRSEEPPLIFQEFVNEPGTAFHGLIPIPGKGHQKGNAEKKQGIAELRAFLAEALSV